MAHPDPTDPSSTDPDSLLCVSCGYDLRRLPTDRACPECGTPIERTLAGDLLAFADPGWLARLARGQALLALGPRLCVIVVLVGIVLQTAWGILGVIVFGSDSKAAAHIDLVSRIIEWTVPAALLGALLVAGAGAMLVSEQEPREQSREKVWSPRALVRWGLGCTIAAVLVREVVEVQVAPPAGLAISTGLVVVIGVAVTVVSVGLLGYLASLAGRVPSETLQMRATRAAATLRWSLPALIILPQAVHLRSLGLNLTSTLAGIVSVFHGLMTCATGIASIVLLVHVFVVTALLGEFRRTFAECARLAPGSARGSNPE